MPILCTTCSAIVALSDGRCGRCRRGGRTASSRCTLRRRDPSAVRTTRSRSPTMASCCGGCSSSARGRRVCAGGRGSAHRSGHAAARCPLLFRDWPIWQSRRRDACGVGSNRRARRRITNTLAWTLERDHQTDEARHMPKWPTRSTRRTARPCACWRTWTAGQATWSRRRRGSGNSFVDIRRFRLGTAVRAGGGARPAWPLRCGVDRAWPGEVAVAPSAATTCTTRIYIRRRQWELTQSVTPADLRRWRQAGDSLLPAKRIAFLTGFPARARRCSNRSSPPTRTPLTPTNRASSPAVRRAVVLEGRRRDERHHRIAFVRRRPTGRRARNILPIDGKLPRPADRRAAADREESVADGRHAAVAADVPGSAMAGRAPRPARRRVELPVHADPAQLDECPGDQRRRGVPVLRRHDAALAVVADRLDWPHAKLPTSG